MKKRWIVILSAALIILSAAGGCSKGIDSQGEGRKQADAHKIVVNVCDKDSGKPVEGARVFVVGDEASYVTDTIGNTKDISVNVDKAYFDNYTEQVTASTGNGFVDLVVFKEGYAKHIELDYSIYPGDFPSVIKIEMEPADKDMFSLKQNYPDMDYVEKMMNVYKGMEEADAVTQGDTQFVVTVTDGAGEGIASSHVVIPEMGISTFTGEDGTCIFNACSAAPKGDYPVEKTYNEITLLTYADGYSSKAVFRVPVGAGAEGNNITIKLTKTDEAKFEEETIVPHTEWIESMVNYYNK